MLSVRFLVVFAEISMSLRFGILLYVIFMSSVIIASFLMNNSNLSLF